MANKPTEQTVKTETVTVEPGRYEEPREKTDPDHKDAGQQYVEQQPPSERQERERREADEAGNTSK